MPLPEKARYALDGKPECGVLDVAYPFHAARLAAPLPPNVAQEAGEQAGLDVAVIAATTEGALLSVFDVQPDASLEPDKVQHLAHLLLKEQVQRGAMAVGSSGSYHVLASVRPSYEQFITVMPPAVDITRWVEELDGFAYLSAAVAEEAVSATIVKIWVPDDKLHLSEGPSAIGRTVRGFAEDLADTIDAAFNAERFWQTYSHDNLPPQEQIILPRE